MVQFAGIAALVLVAAIAGSVQQVSAHGHMSVPECRGCQKVSTAIDDLNNPVQTSATCRGEPAGKVTDVVNHALTLEIAASAPHKGPCSVYILDEKLQNPVKIADKYNCAAPGVPHTWDITLPASMTGRKVLQWKWEGCHVQPCEKYENCADINVLGGGGPTRPKPEVPEPKPEVPEPKPEVPKPKPETPKPAPPKVPYSDDEEPEYEPKPETPKPTTPTTPTTPTKPAEPCDETKPTKPEVGGQCEAGTFTCHGTKFGVCNHGRWLYQSCGAGTTCVKLSNGGVTCGRA